MNKNVVPPIVALVVAMVACQAILPNQPPVDTSDLGCHELIAGVKELRSDLSFPDYFYKENPSKQGGEFETNRYFDVFTHLKMEDDHVLDYVYHQDGFAGFPVLYARPVDQDPYENESEFIEAVPDAPNYLSFVVPQDSPEGYFEYAILEMLADQFYLDWHANYNDWKVLCGEDDIEKIVQSFSGEDSMGRPMTASEKRKARNIKNPEPSVKLSDETAVVKVLLFTKWGGFILRKFTISRSDHSLMDVQDIPQVEYQCGIMF